MLASKDGYPFAPKEMTLGSDPIRTEVALKIVSTIFGTIVDIFGNPLKNVVVQAGDKETITDELGQWKITDLSEGEYTVTASKEGIEYWFSPKNLTLVGEQTQEVNMALVTGFGTIKDKFYDQIAGVTIRVYKKDAVNDDGLLATAVTDEEGYWEVTGLLAPNEYTVVASKNRYIFEQEECMVNLNGLCEPNLSRPDSVLEMTIDAPETVVQDNNITYAITVTNRGDQSASGIVVTDDLPKGTELVSAQVSWYTYYPMYHQWGDFSHCGSHHHTSPCLETTCNLPSLSAGGTCQNRSATVHIVASNHQVQDLRNKVTMTASQFPGDIQYTRTKVVPHFSIFITDNPDPVAIGGFLQYKVDIDLNPTVPKAATGVELKIQLPNGLKLKAVKTDYGTCDISNLPTIICSMTDISLEQANSLSHTVGIDVELTDVGLLLLMFEATVKANEYPAYTVRERTKIDIPNAEEIEVDIAFVIDITGSMQEEIDGIIIALNEFINNLGSGEEELPFEDVQLPSAEEEEGPSETEEAVSSETEEPVSSEAEEPVSSETEEPVSSETEEPVSSETEEALPEAEPIPPLIALITFADEVKIKAFVKAFTRNLDVLREAVDKLKAKGGGTCPEASIEALDFVMPYLKKGGIILFTTDASPYPDADVEGVLKSMRSKGIRFNAMITGDCSTENSWNAQSGE